MLDSQLPTFIQPDRLAREQAQLSGVLKISELSRLVDMLHETTGDVKILLHFDQDSSNRICIKAHIETKLSLICQRCLEGVQYPIDIEVVLSPVENDKQAAALPERYSPILVEKGKIILQKMIEDELLIALPLIARHSEGKCEQFNRV